jgi:hypothetical protein
MDYELLLRLYTRGYRFAELGNAVLANMSYGGLSDRRWIQTLLEAARAKQRHLPLPAMTWAYCGWQVARGGLRRSCERLGLDNLVGRVRKRLSPMRKELA